MYYNNKLMYSLDVVTLNHYSYFMFGYSDNVQCRYNEMSYIKNVNEIHIGDMRCLIKITAAYIHLKQLKAT